MVLREMRWSDIPVLADLELDLFAHDAWAEATWWSELAGRPRRQYVVEEDSAGIAGYAGLDVGSDVADVMTIAVAPRAQGRGLGRTLLEELVERARQEGAEYLLLEVRDDNGPARRLYERAGFEVLTTRRRYYQPGDVDAHIMRRTLKEETP